MTRLLLVLLACVFLTSDALAKRAQVSSLKPSELAEFEDQPQAIQAMLAYALDLTRKRLGYQYGSNDPKKGGMDCSGTVQHILTEMGYSAPRQSNTLYLWVREHGNLREVKNVHAPNDAQLRHLEPGDLLFWEGTYNVGKRHPPTSHVMIYLGKRKSDGRPVMVGASSGRTYQGKSQHGVSVFDFRLPSRGSKTRFVGYGPVPGVKKLSLTPPPLAAPLPGSGPDEEESPGIVARILDRVPAVNSARRDDVEVIDLSVGDWKQGQHPVTAKALEGNSSEPWRYLAYLPERYGRSSEPLPVIFYLHGRSIRGRDLERVKRYGPPALLDRREDFPFVVISPQLPEGFWHAPSLLKLLDEVIETYRVDPDRVYLTGASMGAGGAWELAGRAPERFAAFAPVCAHGGIGLAPKLTDLPIWGFHGSADEIIPIEPHQKLIEAIHARGGQARLSVIPGGTHGNIIMPVYKDEELYDWFLEHRRN